MSPMRQVPFRPGFDHAVEAEPQRVESALGALVNLDGERRGKTLSDHVMLTVRPSERHFWSPFLHLQVEPHRDADPERPEKSYVRGFFTPHPNLWTGFMLGALGNATLVFFSVLWGVVQLQLGTRPTAFWWTLGSLAMGACVLAFSSRGKRRAAPQMDDLHALVEAALEGTGRVTRV